MFVKPMVPIRVFEEEFQITKHRERLGTRPGRASSPEGIMDLRYLEDAIAAA